MAPETTYTVWFVSAMANVYINFMVLIPTHPKGGGGGRISKEEGEANSTPHPPKCTPDLFILC